MFTFGIHDQIRLYLIQNNYKDESSSMSEDKKRAFHERVKSLHDKYTQQLPGKYNEIMNAWDALKTDTTNPESFELFYRLIHTLKGTAATFGFATQSDYCFDIQQVLLEHKDNDNVLTDVDIKTIDDSLKNLKKNIDAPAENIGQA